MKDGNKESIKELLGAFRIISSADLSIILAIVAAKSRIPDILADRIYISSIVALSLSLAGCIYLFLLAIRKIYFEEDAIIESRDVKTTAGLSLLLFLAGVFILIGGFTYA
jgi:hypothetical protein